MDRPAPRSRAADCALFVTLGGRARRVLDASRALRDYPTRHGHELAAHLHLDTHRAGADDAATHVMGLPEGGFDAGPATLREYARIEERARADAFALLRGAGCDVLRVYVLAPADRVEGGWPLLTALQLVQRLRIELRASEVDLVCYLLMTMPAADDRHDEQVARSVALLASLEAAGCLGIEVVPGRVLRAPIADCAVMIGPAQGVLQSMDARLAEAGAVLRALSDAGPRGRTIRGYLEQPHVADPGATRIFTSIGIASLVMEEETTLDLLTDLLLLLDDQAHEESPMRTHA